MGTRAIIQFKDENSTHSVYQHWDGYPPHVVTSLHKLFSEAKLVWTLPRFEADEAAAGFVAQEKTGQGNIRLASNDRETWDYAYQYVVEMKGGKLHVAVYSKGERKALFNGTLEKAATMLVAAA